MTIPVVTVQIRLFEIIGTPLPRARVIFNFARSDIVIGTDGGIVPVGQFVVTVDDNGEGSGQFFPNELGANGTQYGIQIYDENNAQVFPDREGVFALTSIPNVEGVLLHSILNNVPVMTAAEANASVQAAQLAAGRAEAAEDGARVAQDASAASSLTSSQYADASGASATFSSQEADRSSNRASASDASAQASAGSANAAGGSAAGALASKNAADADKAATAADRVQTGADRTQTGADRVQTGADRTQTGLDRTQTTSDKTGTAADRVQTGLDRTATGQDRTQTGLDRTQTGADRTQTGLDRAATTASATAAAGSSTSAGNFAAQAGASSATAGSYPNAASAAVPRGMTQASVGALTPGAGGTNGTFAAAFSGGTGWIYYPTATFTVAGNVLTAFTVTGPGLNIHAAPVNPVVSFAASAGLTGAAVALTMQFLAANGVHYYAASVDGQTLDSYVNVGGVATRDATMPSISTAAAMQATADLHSRPVAGSQYAHIDGDGKAALLLENGIHKFALAEAESFNGVKRAELTRRLARKNLFFSADIVHHIVFGQSLSLGQGGGLQTLPSIDGGFYDCLRFSANGTTYAGPRAQEGTGTVAQNHSALVPYLEQPITGTSPTGNGETILGTAFRTIKRMLRDEDGILPTDFDYLLLGSAPGISNTAISGFAKGSAAYLRLIDDVTYGLARAQELGKTYAVDAVHWIQGEKDVTDGTTRATYLAALLLLYTNVNADVKAITGQAHDIKWVTYQVTFLNGTQQVALAQLDAVKQNPDKFIMAGPVYVTMHLDPVQVHLTGIGYAHQGAMHGFAVKRGIIEGTPPPPMYPRRLIRQGNVLEAEWPDTGYPLAFSTTYFAQLANQGFTAVGTDLVTDNPITSVTLLPKARRVRYGLTNAAPGYLRYGFINGWGGNMHDTCDFDPALIREIPLYAPCLTFEEPFA